MSNIYFVYLDYQASTPICENALEEMRPFLSEEFANPHSSQHIAGIKSLQAIDNAKVEIAKFLNADASEIIFTSGATEANNLALLGMCSESSEKKRILISFIEHKCVIAPAQHLRSLGYQVDFIPVTSNGTIDMVKYEAMLDSDVKLVSIMAVNNEIGSIQPIKECAILAQQYGALFHTDAAQAPSCIELDVREMGVDLVSLSSHKMYGPKGIGALFVSHELQREMQPIIWGGGQQNGLRAGTLPTQLCVGFGAAAKFLRENRETIREETRQFRNYFWTELQGKINDIQLIGPSLDDRHVGNLNIAFNGIDAEVLLGMLQTNIAASTGSACTSGVIEPSHVLNAIGLQHGIAETCIRFSFGSLATLDQMDFAVSKISKAVRAMTSLTLADILERSH